MRVFIGVDPHKLSVTIEVIDTNETVLATGRFATDNAGYRAMRKHVAAGPERTWVVEGSNGASRARGAAHAGRPPRRTLQHPGSKPSTGSTAS